MCVCVASNQSGVMCRPADCLSGCRASWLPADGLHLFLGGQIKIKTQLHGIYLADTNEGGGRELGEEDGEG